MTNDSKQPADTQLGGIVGSAGQGATLVRVNDHVWVSRDVSDSILVATQAGSVVVNAGMPGKGSEHRRRFAEVDPLPIAYLIITQCHADHFGGAMDMRDPGTRIITHERYEECREYWRVLHDFYTARSGKLWGSLIANRSDIQRQIREVTPDITLRDDHAFELGGRRFELYAAPGGESEDGLVVWLPQDRLAITGNLFGPVFGSMPNLYTIRGDKIRSARRFIQSLDFVRGLQPEVIVTGHEVITGEAEIQGVLAQVRDAVSYVFNYTVDGMNAGRDVHTLMREVALPEPLRIGQAHGKLAWCVRAIWEEYAGWFHYDATTSLYAVPAASVAADIVELAGGADALAQRARRYLAQQQPLQALHLLDTALVVEPANALALQGKIDAHQQLLEGSKGENFSEVMWLKSEQQAAQAALDEQRH